MTHKNIAYKKIGDCPYPRRGAEGDPDTYTVSAFPSPGTIVPAELVLHTAAFDAPGGTLHCCPDYEWKLSCDLGAACHGVHIAHVMAPHPARIPEGEPIAVLDCGSYRSKPYYPYV